ncbi:hypothetical protein MGG_05963 [Pyricularia oryzae 70-15]|uniref:Ribosomal RNA-processing protein 15 n=3 Tax=Pyricularia oryzae TaxID=318829 RepID=G4N4C8_PYRO7|nr:uncharacterized protein MGG_05963 [Pyricularia oryzae 70-15]EHA51996.1 hypothetical protein MGG_05963 [Pyricularia oryzae 70-15]ELQ33150.1 hypothetical protein OOU_Y34scaffold00995g4 [Pyricularia oryzae Y34]KAI7927616.1 hypothetical protein M0657_003194 [Pyricularia oryzae]KAI7928232.1 hypothetical protein M9X92_001920 [Pyricularia oryzae]
MAGGYIAKKRSRDEANRQFKGRPRKKPRKGREFHSDSEDGDDGGADGQSFAPVNLLDSDEEDIHNLAADDGQSSGADDSSDDEASTSRQTRRKPTAKPTKTKQKEKSKKEAQDSSDDDDEDEDDDSSDDDDDDAIDGQRQRKQSKRNDPTAFATSMSKILSTKLSTSRRADPVLSRSAAAHEAARLAVDTALEAKAHRKMAEQRRAALEKGRVKDVLVSQEGQTAEMQAGEKRLRKTAQRGVIKLFNAIRAAQVKAADAERAVRSEGVIGMGKREQKVAEMSKKGFLDLIAGGGGGLNKAPLEEA